jgi:hypothetical protein
MTERLYTPKCVISYPHLFVARSVEGGEPKFSASFIFYADAQKTKEFAALKAAIRPTAEAEWGAKLPPNLKNPFLDAAKYNFPAGTVMIRCNSKSAPGVVDAKVQKIIDPNEIYPGAIVIATVNCFAWDTRTGKGVSFGLGNIQKVGDGPRLDNRKSADDDFGGGPGADGTAPSPGESQTIDDIFR